MASERQYTVTWWWNKRVRVDQTQARSAHKVFDQAHVEQAFALFFEKNEELRKGAVVPPPVIRKVTLVAELVEEEDEEEQ